jgi:tRNA(fMet)-specific endonuclease VapC
MTDVPLARIVVDTDVVSFIHKRDTRAEFYTPHLKGRIPVISFMTLAELDRWALERNWGHRRCNELETLLRDYVVYPYDRALCRMWAQASSEAKRCGRAIQSADAWIAATALLIQAPLLTNNPDDFAGVAGLPLISAPAA